MQFTLLDKQLTLPRNAHGTDFGAEGKVILKKGQVYLVRRKGFMGWHGIGTYVYIPSRLRIEDHSEHFIYSHDIFEGRVTKAILKQFLPDIKDRFFSNRSSIDEIIEEQLHPNHTIVIED
ncbi:MAG: hypothetical protein WC783_00205 [Candidatus Paceibacterota bacterium]|jgi:hypothetical protein